MSTCTCDTFASTSSTPTVSITNTGTGEGLRVTQTTSNSNAVEIQHNGSSTSGLWANCTSSGAGVTGSCTGNGSGVQGINNGTGIGYGVYGSSNSTSGTGGYFTARNGVEAHGTAIGGLFYGGASSYGVFGNGPTGVYGTPGGVAGGIGVYGSSGISGAYAGYFDYKVYVAGFLTKAGGGYQIDHPADPENKYLNHCFVESPEMMNVYRGRATFDANGEAVINLPSYFSAAAETPEYQLTPIGQAMPDLHVAEEIIDGVFKLAGGRTGKSVSWQVTAARADKWAKANHPGVEVEKSEEDKGLFMHPELFGHDRTKNINKYTRESK